MTTPAEDASEGPGRIEAAALALVGAPDGTPSGRRRVFQDRVPDLWSVQVDTPDRLLIAHVRAAGGRVTVPAGLDHAGRELAEMKLLDRSDWNGSSIHLVAAAGGWSPGWPDVPIVKESRDGGGMRITIETTEPWVRYAASGGAGPPPRESSAPSAAGGVTAPEKVGTLTLDIGRGYDLRWSWRLGGGGRDLGSCAAQPARSLPTLADDVLLKILDSARRKARAPRAMPLSEPKGMSGFPDVMTVELCVLGKVHVDLVSRAIDGDVSAAATRLKELGVDLAAPPPAATFLALLEATGGLPAGLLASDLRSARMGGGELVADVSGPLWAWSKAGATGLTPRSPRWIPDGDAPPPDGRVRLKIEGGRTLVWSFEDR